MKSIIAVALLGLIAVASAGFISGYSAVPAISPYPYSAYPYAYSAYSGLSTLGHNYKLGLDTSLPGSAYASYPYAAAPTAYGYGVYKTL